MVMAEWSVTRLCRLDGLYCKAQERKSRTIDMFQGLTTEDLDALLASRKAIRC